jgi:hypothetical protein
MRRFWLAVPLAVLVLGGFVSQAQAQDSQKSRGTVTAMAGDSITVKVGAADVKFTIDQKTHVEAPGGGTKTRQAAAAGAAGPKLSEILKVGDAVEVSYHDAGGRHADLIRKVSSPGSGGVPGHESSGTVTAVSATSLSISGSSGGGGTFTQTFTIDDKTKVTARGATHATATTGGRATFTSLVGKGDHVNVSFEDASGTLRASEVRVTAKGKS